MDDFEKFIESVRAMRKAQKLYFQIRTQRNLDDSKRLEKVVDAMLENGGKREPALFE